MSSKTSRQTWIVYLKEENNSLRKKIIEELGKIHEDAVFALGEITINDPYDSHSDLTVEGATTGVITVSDGRNESFDMFVSDMDNRTLLNILSQFYHEQQRLVKVGVDKLKERLEEKGLSVEEK